MVFIPTYLYIKQHSITGKLYFGKTFDKRGPIKYPGSGTIWKRHIKKHSKEHVVTLWFYLFESKEELIEFALKFSNEMNIVNSDQWLNLIPENGLGGYSFNGKTHTKETKIKMAKSAKASNHRNPENNLNRSKSLTGNSNALGLIHSNKSKLKMRLAKIGSTQNIITCPHCQKSGGNTMKRWHFDNCKFK